MLLYLDSFIKENVLLCTSKPHLRSPDLFSVLCFKLFVKKRQTSVSLLLGTYNTYYEKRYYVS